MAGVAPPPTAADRCGPAKRPSRVRTGLAVAIVVTIGVRVLLFSHIAAQHPEYLVHDLEAVAAGIGAEDAPYMNDFGFEASNIAFAWVCGGQGFASPFGGFTGPTAWIAPGVVAIYAVSFALWGCFSTGSILFAYLLALVISVATTVLVYRIAGLVSGELSVGVTAALLFAVLPYEAWIFHTSSQLDFNLQVLCFAALLLAVLRVVDDPSRAGLALGAVSALAALFNPGFLLCTAVGFALAFRVRDGRGRMRLAASLAVAHLVLLAPYVMWQSARLGAFVPVKSNAPVELLIGNTATASGLLRHQVFLAHHPSQNDEQFALYRALGEAAYVELKQRQFLAGFDLGEFVDNTVRRAYQFFAGYQVKSWDHSAVKVLLKRLLWSVFFLSLVALLAIGRGRPSRLETTMLLFTFAYSTPYLVTGIMERYRIPVTPAVAVAIALVITQLRRLSRAPEDGPTSA